MSRRKSSRGNPWHDARGRFCHGPQAEKDTWGNPISDEQRKEAVCHSEKTAEGYDAQTKFRNGEIDKAEVGGSVREPVSHSTGFEAALKEAGFSFTPATTIAEAEEYARSFGVRPYYKGLSLETCNALNESLGQTLTMFPKTQKWLKVCGNAQQINKEKKKAIAKYLLESDYAEHCDEAYRKKAATWMASRLTGRCGSSNLAHTYMEMPVGQAAGVRFEYMGIYLNSNRDGTYEQIMEHNTNTGFHPVGCTTTKSIIDHEMGHVIHAAYGGKIVDMSDKRAISEELSKYGAHNVKEYHAEAWSEFVNNPTPRARAKEIGEEFLGRR